MNGKLEEPKQQQISSLVKNKGTMYIYIIPGNTVPLMSETHGELKNICKVDNSSAGYNLV
jgi:hypothetical protein